MARTSKATAKVVKAPAKKAKTTAKPAAATSARAKAAPKPAAKKAPAAKAPAKATAAKAQAKTTTAKAPAKSAARASTTKSAAAAPARVIPALAKRAPLDGTRKPPPKRKGPLDKFLLGQQAALEEERATYTRQAASLKAEADLLVAEREPGDVQFDEESGEGDTLAVERERDLALSAQASAAVEEIDRALVKLRDGTYGVCEQCYATIPKERLRALPYAALCVQCKSAGFTRR